MKKTLGVLAMCVALCACVSGPLQTKIDGTTLVLNSERYTIGEGFHLAAIVEIPKSYERTKCYVYKNPELESWIILNEKLPIFKAKYYGSGKNRELKEKRGEYLDRMFYWFEVRKWKPVELYDPEFKMSELSKKPVDIVYYNKLISDRKAVSVFLISVIDQNSPDKKSHISELEQGFRKISE